MNVAHVLSQEDLNHQRRLCFVGGLLTGLLFAVVMLALIKFTSRAPVITSQTHTRTTAAVSTLYYGIPRECTVTIDHWRGVYAVRC